jgi:predicted nucleic acid-binding protein
VNYLLDSDLLIDYFNLRGGATALVEGLLDEAQVAVSVVTIAEIRAGWDQRQSERFLPLLYDLFPAENVTPAIAELAGRWRQEYRTRGQTLSTADTLIAATAFRAGRCLVTRNVKHYPMPELQRYRGL